MIRFSGHLQSDVRSTGLRRCRCIRGVLNGHLAYMYGIDELSTSVVGRPRILFSLLTALSNVRTSPLNVVLKSLTWNTKLSHQQPQPLRLV